MEGESSAQPSGQQGELSCVKRDSPPPSYTHAQVGQIIHSSQQLALLIRVHIKCLNDFIIYLLIYVYIYYILTTA